MGEGIAFKMTPSAHTCTHARTNTYTKENTDHAVLKGEGTLKLLNLLAP